MTAPALPTTAEPLTEYLSADVWSQLGVSLRLSQRELQIAKAVLAGQQQDVIAQNLGLTPFMVYRTLQRIYIKLHIGSRLELKERVKSQYQALSANSAERCHHAGSIH